MDDRAALDRLVDGAWGVFSVQNFWEVGYEAEVRQGKNVADAAKAAGVTQLVYSSVGSAWNDTGLEHFDCKWEIEEHIREIDLSHTILRPVFFMQNLEGMREMILGGKLAFPLSPGTRLQMVNVYDIGVFAGMAFDAADSFRGRALDLAGDELSMAELAETLRDITGAPVEYIKVEWDDFREQMGAEYEKMMRWFEDVGYEADIPALRTMHPQLMRFEQYLRSHGWEGAGRSAPTAD